MNLFSLLAKNQKAVKKKEKVETKITVRAGGDGRSSIKITGTTSMSAILTSGLMGMSKRKLTAMGLYMENLHLVNNGPLDVVGNRAIEMIKARMRQGKAIDGSPFAPLSESYTKRKKQYMKRGKFGNKRVPQPPSRSALPPKSNLFLTGGLYRSLRYWKKKNPNNVPTITVGVGANKGFALMLHEGRFNMPARPFLGLSNREMEILSRRFRRELTVGLGKEILKRR